MNCSKCKDRQAKKGQRWCKRCFAEYMREHRKITQSLARGRAYREGQAAFKQKLIDLFESLRFREMNGLTAAEIVRTAETVRDPI